MKKTTKPKQDNRAVSVHMRADEIDAVEADAARAGLTFSAYARDALMRAGGHSWPPLLARGKYQRTKGKGKQEVEGDE